MLYVDRPFSAKEPCNWWLVCWKCATTQGILRVSTTLYESDATIQCDATHVHYYYIQLPKNSHAHSCTNQIDYIFTLTHSTALRTRIHTDTKCLHSNHALFAHALTLSYLLALHTRHHHRTIHTHLRTYTRGDSSTALVSYISLVPGGYD